MPGLSSLKMLCALTIALFFFNDTATTEIYTLSLHDALPISMRPLLRFSRKVSITYSSITDYNLGICWLTSTKQSRSEEHTSELQSLRHLVCRLLLEKKMTPDLATTRLRDIRCRTSARRYSIR